MWRCALSSGAEVATLGTTAPGRGAWVCSPACFDTAVHRKRFERAWRRPLPDGALDEVRQALTIAFESTPEKMRQWSAAGRSPGASTPMKG
jgi:predicted RNA-binding protein YlxR (DUF448 family)